MQDRPAAVCGADRPTARESAFPMITLKIFGKRERKNHMNWNIITDSSCDLLPSTSPDGRIRLTSVPFTIRIGERDFVDDEHLDTMEMLYAMEQEHSAGHTSCPTPDAWLAQFEQADCAIAITISSQLSGSMNSALAARDMALEKNPDKKIKDLEKIFEIYTGEFLVKRQSVIWVAIEARRYEDMFRECVEEAAGLYREKQNYTQLEHLGVYASNIEPFSDWEALTMEAMVALGRYEEATDLYAETAERYFEERGLKPSKRLLDSMNQLGNQVMHSYDVLDNIQHNLEEKGIPKGAYLCSYPTFRGIYHHLVRMLERSGQSIYLMLCTIVDSKGRPMKEGAMLEGLAKRLEESICTSIRNSDVVNHYSKGQYLVLLINTTREDCAVIQKRINYKFLTDRQRTGVRYYVNSVVYEKDL